MLLSGTTITVARNYSIFKKHPFPLKPRKPLCGMTRASTRKRADIKLLYFFPGPGCFAQKLQAGFHRGIVLETIDVYLLCQHLPSVVIRERSDKLLQSRSVQRVIRLLILHCSTSLPLPSPVGSTPPHEPRRRSSGKSLRSVIPAKTSPRRTGESRYPGLF